MQITNSSNFVTLLKLVANSHEMLIPFVNFKVSKSWFQKVKPPLVFCWSVDGQWVICILGDGREIDKELVHS